jgi:NOL1/NOP2/fmu family ribosome biogenesis protein
MQSVKVYTVTLLNVLKENREKHLKDYNSASKIFIQDAIAKLQEMLKTAKTEKRIIHSLGLVEPKSYVDSYDTAIKMLEMSVEEVIELTQQEFTQYVEDNWNWKSQFVSTTAFYNSKLA